VSQFWYTLMNMDPTFVLKTTSSTLSALEIVPHHLRLHLEKFMSLTSKRNLHALGVQMFKQGRRNLLQRGTGKIQFFKRLWNF
jgi:hypothetical protein